MRQTGGIRKQRGRWLGLWYENGVKKSKVLGMCKDMTKGQARDAVADIVKSVKPRTSGITFGGFVEGPYFNFYSRKWKPSTCENNKQRIRTHLVAEYKDRELSSFKRDELQDLMDRKAKDGLSFSVVDHLRWDLKQIFDMAIAESHITLNPAVMLFTPKDAPKPKRRVMTIQDVQRCLGALPLRERLIAKFAVLA